MEFVKGYYDENEKFIPEGSSVRVVTVFGEVVVGRMLKPAGKQFLLQANSIVRVLRVDEIEEFGLADDYDGEE
jgi:hypothetical protein